MAIRNTKLGGSDWNFGDEPLAADFNDTYDEIVDIVDAGN